MPNEFATKPELALGFPTFPTVWTCPVTGLKVPKDPSQNLAWRLKMLEMAEEDTELQRDLYTACSQSLLFFVNAFCWTLRIFETGDLGKVKQADHAHIPFVTWPLQDEHFLWLEHHIEEGEDGLTDKSRDMGATWSHIAVLAHRLNFRGSESHLVLSRKQDAVDQLDGLPRNYPLGNRADPGTLFGKLDYIQAHLPRWMQPRMMRKKMHVVNLDNGTRVDGESANATAGSSDRRTSILLDEMAKMEEGESIKRSTRDVSACRLACSTPNGPGTAFSKWRMSGTVAVFVLPWWEHPEKGKDRYVDQDESGRYKIRSPWYNYEEGVRSPKELAIEVDMDHIGSGDTFFEAHILEEHKRLFCKPPRLRIAINWKKEVAEAQVAEKLVKRDLTSVRRSPKGPLKLWVPLVGGRLDQRFTYTVAADISKGQGASNSALTVKCDQTQEKVAAWADANTPPYEFARIVTAICVWVGGKGALPLLIWENNGDPGFDFGRQVVRVYQYPRVYFDRVIGTVSEKAGKRYGWRSSPEKKATALGLLRRAYAHGGFINHDEDAVEEAKSYVKYASGGIGPAALVEESDSARKCHGDRVIADMLAVWVQDGFHGRPVREERGSLYTIGGRLAAFKSGKKHAARKQSFDWRN